MISESDAHLPEQGRVAQRNGDSALPEGASIQHIAFVAAAAEDAHVVVRFPPPIQHQAVLVAKDNALDAAPGELSMLVVPCAERELLGDAQSDLVAQVRHSELAVLIDVPLADFEETSIGPQG